MTEVTARPSSPPPDGDRFGSSSRLWKIAFLVLMAATLIALAARWLDGENDLSDAPVTGVGFTRVAGPDNYVDELARAESAVHNNRVRLSDAPEQWLRRASYTGALARRASLTGNYVDLVAIDDELARAFRDAPEGAGPVIGAAAHALTVHRLDEVEKYLNIADGFAVAPDNGTRAEMLGMRGDVALYRGDYDAALRNYRAALHLSEDAGGLIRLYTFELKHGRFDEAAANIRRAGATAKTPSPYLAAFYFLRLADVGLASGDWTMAQENIDAANHAFQGWWLAEAYRAQMLALNGDVAGAVALYTQVANRSHDPLVMDALGSLLRANGRIAESRQWAARAQVIWDRRMAALPSAARGHAIEHELALGDPAKALRIAAADYKARPYGQAAIMLATAQLANGQTEKALALLKRTEKSGWVSARAWALQAEAEALLGHGKASDRARTEAEKIDPKVFDPAQSYIWFGHG
ncbi:hypothetical protein [Novosphingopyxis sp.]|uniref:hypothetical protein n=1 Tax=Novosphingopyxis sp. TaxID=2709690 RepID=UPI003B5C64EE